MTHYQTLKEISPSLRSVEMTAASSQGWMFGAARSAAPNIPFPFHPFNAVTSTENIERSEILKGEVSIQSRKGNSVSFFYEALYRGIWELEMTRLTDSMVAEEVGGGIHHRFSALKTANCLLQSFLYIRGGVKNKYFSPI